MIWIPVAAPVDSTTSGLLPQDNIFSSEGWSAGGWILLGIGNSSSNLPGLWWRPLLQMPIWVVSCGEQLLLAMGDVRGGREREPDDQQRGKLLCSSQQPVFQTSDEAHLWRGAESIGQEFDVVELEKCRRHLRQRCLLRQLWSSGLRWGSVR